MKEDRISDITGRGPGWKPSIRLAKELLGNEWGFKMFYPVTGLIVTFIKCLISFKKCMKHYADFKGRLSRSEFLWSVLSLCLAGGIAFFVSLLVVALIFTCLFNSYILVVGWCIIAIPPSILVVVPLLSCMVRRCHDMEESGWLLLFPVYNLVLLFSPSVLRSEVNADGTRVLVVTTGQVIGDTMEEYLQHGPTCAVKAQQIILNEFGVNVSENECVEYATSRGWFREMGTPLRYEGNLLEHCGVPIRRYEHATINDLMRELTQGHMVIARVDSSELYWNAWLRLRKGDIIQPDHDIIVNGIDVSDPYNEVAYITDSSLGIHNYDCPLDNFMDAWQDSKGFMLATRNPVPGWSWGEDIKPYEFNLDDYPYNLVPSEWSDMWWKQPTANIPEKEQTVYDPELGKKLMECSNYDARKVFSFGSFVLLIISIVGLILVLLFVYYLIIPDDLDEVLLYEKGFKWGSKKVSLLKHGDEHIETVCFCDVDSIMVTITHIFRPSYFPSCPSYVKSKVRFEVKTKDGNVFLRSFTDNHGREENKYSVPLRAALGILYQWNRINGVERADSDETTALNYGNLIVTKEVIDSKKK